MNPYEEGRIAYRNDRRMIDNPYERLSDEAEAWIRGWRDEWYSTLNKQNSIPF